MCRLAAATESHRIARRSLSATTKTNQILLWAIVTLLALAVIPIGSNRPFFWFVNAMVVGGLGLVYAILIRVKARGFRVPLTATGVAGSLFSISFLWMVVQLVPLPFPSSSDWVEASRMLGSEVGGSISVEPAATVGMIIRYGTYSLLFFLVLQAAASPHRARVLLKAVFWITVSHAAIAIVMLLELGDRLIVFPKWAYLGFATGFFVNRNSFATFVAMGMTVGTILALD